MTLVSTSEDWSNEYDDKTKERNKNRKVDSIIKGNINKSWQFNKIAVVVKLVWLRVVQFLP